jgi:hypothetical protein
MQLPALKNSAAALSLPEDQSLEEYIRNSTKSLQRMANAMPGNGLGNVAYLSFNGNTGEFKLNKEPIDAKSLGRILVPHHGLFETMIEWANGSLLQKVPPRQLLGVDYDEPMSERLFTKPTSPHLYKKEGDGPTLTYGFVGFLLDDGSTISFEHSSKGGVKAVNTLATSATQALVAFGELVHPVIELDSGSKELTYRTVYDPRFTIVGFVTDKRAREVDVISDDDILTRPAASKARVTRERHERPAL